MPADDDSASPLVQGTTVEAGVRTTHRLMPEDRLRRKLKDKPEVVDWIMAVRRELVGKYGEIGTLAAFAREIKARTRCDKTKKNVRARLSEQLTGGSGPSWKNAEYVLRYVVSDQRRSEVEEEFARLYGIARPHGEPAPIVKAPPPASSVQLEAPEVEALPAVDSATTGELRGLVTELRQAIRDAEAAAAEATAEREKEKNELREALAAQTAEASRLRENVQALSLVAQRRPPSPAQRRTGPSRPTEPPWDTLPPYAPGIGRFPAPATSAGYGYGPSSVDPPARFGVLSRPSVAHRYTALALLDQQTPTFWGNTTGRDELEEFWLSGPYWADMRRGGQLNSGQVNSRFKTLTDELTRQGFGAAPQTSSVPPPAAAPVRSGWWARLRRHRGRHHQLRPAPDRTPRDWSSRGPGWFYALLGSFAAAGVASLTMVAALPEPAAPRTEGNPLVELINDPYTVNAPYLSNVTLNKPSGL